MRTNNKVIGVSEGSPGEANLNRQAVDNLSRDLLGASIINFQQKLSMTSPSSSMGKFSSLFYPNYVAGWPLPPQNLANPYLHQGFSLFPNQLAVPYLLPQSPYLSSYQTLQMNPSALLMTSPGGQRVPQRLPSQMEMRPSQRNQKKMKKQEAQIVNLISDQQDPIQPEKPCQDKNSTSNSKSSEYNQKQVLKITPDPLPAPSVPVTDKPEPLDPPKPPKVQKVQKKKQTHKQKPLRKKPKHTPSNLDLMIQKGQVTSKRIIEKQINKKEPFRLSKRQRELLEVGELRELTTGILTGPQFQAKLPKFHKLGHSAGLPGAAGREWLQRLRTDLLQRKYNEQSDDE